MKRSGTIGWAFLSAYVVAWDLVALFSGHETLTSAFWRGTHHPVSRLPVTVVWLVTTAHLFGVLPARMDPISLLGQQIGRIHSPKVTIKVSIEPNVFSPPADVFPVL